MKILKQILSKGLSLFIFFEESIIENTHHPTNKKPHECGA